MKPVRPSEGFGLPALIAAVMTPLCVWGMISTLILFLVDLRSALFTGGEWRLRVSVISFAAGVVLIQRMGAIHGKTAANSYALALGAAITAFAMHEALSYRVPGVSWPLVFLINEALFMALWWTGSRISAAVSVDKDLAKAAAETGALKPPKWLSVTKRREAEAEAERTLEGRWVEPLKGTHPARVLLYFSLGALAIFGAGTAMLGGGESPIVLRLGVYLFVYLWCVFALLFLSSMTQLRAYFEQRGVTLPDFIGSAWLGIGFTVVTIALLFAFFLPQPPTRSGGYVRARMMSTFTGWESKWGVRDTAQGSNPADGKGAGQGAGAEADGTDGGAGDGTAGEGQAGGGENQAGKGRQPNATAANQLQPDGQPMYRNAWEPNEVTDKITAVFEKLVKVLVGIGALGALVLLYMLIAGTAGAFRGRMTQSWLNRRARRAAVQERRDRALATTGLAGGFARFMGGFAEGTVRDGNAFARHVWQALLAYCADKGTPCAPDVTPGEFLASQPPALAGFEPQAVRVADLFCFSEFSGSAIGERQMQELEALWDGLKRHAGKG